MNDSIINQLEAVLDETVQLLSSFTQKEANTVPFEGSWTAAQVGQHLFLAEKNMDKLLMAPTEVADRQPDANVAQLKSIFLNYENKFESPEFIAPEDREYNKEELVKSLEDVKLTLLEAVQIANLAQEAPLPPGHPLAGNTKLEIMYFVIYHTTRHNKQLRNIHQSFKKV